MEKDSLYNEMWPTNLVDLDTKPFVPIGYYLKEHRKGGIVEIEELDLYFSKKVKSVTKILEENQNENLANSNFLDYLLLNHHLISESWKGYSLLFAGTVYQNLTEDLFVRRLFFENNYWSWNFCSTNELFTKKFTLVLLG